MAVRAFAALSWFYRWGCREGGKHPLRCLGAKTVVGMCIGALFVRGWLGEPTPVSHLLRLCWFGMP